MKNTLLVSVTIAGLVGVAFAMTPNFGTDVLPWMNSNSLTKFSTSADFRPNDAITRGESSKFVASFGQLRKLTKKTSSCSFSDLGSYDSSLKPSITTACELGLLKGSNGKFLPNDSLTEAQALAIVIRALEGFKDETMSPWYKAYYMRAQELGLITTETQSSVNTTKVTRGKLGTRFYIAEHGTMQKDNMMKDETIMKDTGIYTTYAEDAVKAALAEGKKVVLFFHAARCPACVSADKEITATTLPENSVIFKVNYDTATDLKKSYGVTSQHTYVFLGSDMQATNKKVGLATSDAIAMLK